MAIFTSCRLQSRGSPRRRSVHRSQAWLVDIGVVSDIDPPWIITIGASFIGFFGGAYCNQTQRSDTEERLASSVRDRLLADNFSTNSSWFPLLLAGPARSLARPRDQRASSAIRTSSISRISHLPRELRTCGASCYARRRVKVAAGCGNIFKEKASGAKSDRPELAKAIRRLEHGDVLIVTRLDRLARLENNRDRGCR
jgi:hypothetical protein